MGLEPLPAQQRTYAGPESGAGASYRWVGNRKVGSGQMTITDVDAPERLAIDLQFLKPFKAQNTTLFTLTPQGGSTLVKWTMTGKVTWMSKIMGLFMNMDRVVGKDFEHGLDRLKALVEPSG